MKYVKSFKEKTVLEGDSWKNRSPLADLPNDIIVPIPKELLSLDKDTDTVYANEREFLEHYSDLNEKELDNATSQDFLDAMMQYEISKKSDTKRYI